MIGRVVAVLAVGAIGAVVSIAPTPAQAETGYGGPCTDNVGVTVVVDFKELGGGVNVRCAPGPVATGLDALDRAGIAWESTRRFAGFVCRIAGRPGADSEPCGNTPPATAYWGYWVAPRGGQWCYSNLGPGSRKPPPGSIEGWSFALNKVGAEAPPPGSLPPAAIDGQAPNPLSTADCGIPTDPAPAPTTAATPAPTTTEATTLATAPPTPRSPTTVADAQPSTTAGTATTDAASTAPVAAGTSSTTTETAPPAPTTSATTAAATAAAASTSSTASTTAVTTTSVVPGTVDLTDDRRSGGGSGATTVIGATAAIGLAGAGAWAARRRRATS